MLKRRAEISTKLYCQIDGAQGLTSDGWVMSSITLLFNRFDQKRQRYVRSPFTPFWCLHFSECHAGYTYFFTVVKNLPKSHFGLKHYFNIVMQCQDRADYIQTAVKEVFPHCISGTCSVHVDRKFNDGTVGKRLQKYENIDVIKENIQFLISCKTKRMMNYHTKLFMNYWMHVLNEKTWAVKFSKYYLSETEWYGMWCMPVFGKPGMIPDANVVENTHMSEQKSTLQKVDKKRSVGNFVKN